MKKEIEGIKIEQKLGKIYPSVDSILDYFRQYESEIDGVGHLCIFSDRSGKLELKELNDYPYIIFDSLENLVSLLHTFVVEVVEFSEFSLWIDILDFKGYTVCRLESYYDEKIDNDVNFLQGKMKDGKDLQGLQSFLIEKKVLPKDSTLVFEYPNTGRMIKH